MAEQLSGPSPWQQYEHLLFERYNDVPDDWDMYEDTEALRQAFNAGQTAEQVFTTQHYPTMPNLDPLERMLKGNL